MLRAIVYVSSAKNLLDDAELEEQLTEARALNQQNGITGVLLYKRGSFMQYIEGEAEAVADTYKRLLISSEHHNISLLLDTPIACRNFDVWTMGLAAPTGSQLLALSTAEWQRAMNPSRGVIVEPLGPSMLRKFWASAEPRLL